MSVDISYVFTTVVTLFAILIIGVLTRVFGIIDWQTTKKISSFLVNVTQPLLILCSFQTDFTSDKLKIGMAILGASAVFHIAFSIIARLVCKSSEKSSRAVLEFGLIFGNCAYLGYPVLAAIFGQDGYFYGAFFSLFFNVYIRVYGIFLLNRGHKGVAVLKSALFNTGILASIVGIIIFVFSIKLPTFLFDAFSLVGNTTFPISMIVVGSLICNQPLKKLFKPELYVFSFSKLILFPPKFNLPYLHYNTLVCVNLVDNSGIVVKVLPIMDV
ncbi:MAG: AEC family transporter, partial [Clostridia bacterium]